MVDSINSLPEIVLRSAVVYLAILIGFRIAGKRHISQLSLVDFALVLLVSNAVQNAMVGNDSSLTGGLVAATTLIAINLVLTRLIFKNERIGHAIQGEPSLLVRNGRPILPHLQREDIRPEELEESIREHGVETLAEVKSAILEMDGSISIIPFPQNGKFVEHHLPPLPKRKRNRRGLLP